MKKTWTGFLLVSMCLTALFPADSLAVSSTNSAASSSVAENALQQLLDRMPQLQGFQIESKEEIPSGYLVYLEKGTKIVRLILDFETGAPKAIGLWDTDKNNYSKERSVQSMDDAALMQTAELFVQHLLGTQEHTYRAYEIVRDSETRVMVYRYVNGIRFDDDYVVIFFDPAGEVANGLLQRNGLYEDHIFSAPTGILDSTAAQQALYAHFRLQYRSLLEEQKLPQASQTGETRAYLVYAPFLESPIDGLIDARSGEVSPVSELQRLAIQPKGSAPNLRTLEEASSFMQDGFGIDLSKSQASTKKQNENIYFTWDQERNRIAGMTVHAQSGNLMRLELAKTSPAQKLAPDSAKEKVLATMALLLPQTNSEVFSEEGNKEPVAGAPWLYRIYESKNGVIVSDHYFEAALNDEVLIVKRYGLPQEHVPAPVDSVDPKLAYEAYLQEHPLELIYTTPAKGEKPILVYIPTGDRNVHIDAVTGKPVREAGDTVYTGEEK